MFISALKLSHTGSTWPVQCYRKISMFCSFNLGVGGRAGNRNGRATIINTNANTNTNGGATVNGATVTVNAMSEEEPGDGTGSESGKSP